MKIGIISDSHGKVRRLQAAIEALRERDIEALVHCGDIGGIKCMQLLGSCRIKAYAVGGNTDRKVWQLEQAADEYGVHFASEVIGLPLDNGQSLIAAHGDDVQVLNELITEGQFSYVCYGHTHRFSDEMHGPVRVINPGALVHPRYPHHPTAVVLDTETDTLERIDL